MNRFKRACVLALACCLLLGCLVLPGGAAAASELTVTDYPTGYTFGVTSRGRYANWAGVSTVSQFTDAQGNFCFAADDGSRVTVYKTSRGQVTGTVVIDKPYETFGAAACDGSGNLYMVWGNPNSTDDTSVNTIIVGKYSSAGKLIAEAGGNGSEGMAYYYGERFYTQTPFDAGNCDVAMNGDLLLVNYARHMYSGHQANTVFVVDTDTMQVQTGIISYNSHSFDQRATAYSKTGGFLLASQGDCFPRAFTASVTDRTQTLNEMDTFHFWVQPGAYDDYNMQMINATRSRLGNILESGSGAVLVGSSVRSLSEDALSEPRDVFVQVFDPRGSASSASSYVTSGTRSGLAGNNGDEQTTDYGVSWLTDLAGSGMSVDVVQAVNAWDGRIAVLYELSDSYGYYDSTWCVILNENGSVYRKAFSLGQVRLNTDEDPVFAQNAVQWISNASGSSEMVLHSLGYGGLEVLPGSIASVTAEAAAGKITLRWSKASDADTYLLQRRVTGSSTWTTLSSAATGTAYTDSSCTPGTTYQYRVRGRNASGYGPFTASAAVKAAAAQPGSIASVTAEAAPGKITLRWSKASDAETYLLQRRVTGSSTWTTLSSAAASTAYTDTTAVAGTTYQYRVRGRNASGYGPFTVSSAVKAAAAQPGSIASVTTESGPEVILVRWGKAANAEAYVVQRRVTGSSSWTTLSSSVTGTAYTDTTGVAGTVYQYRVRGRNASGYGPFTASSAVRAIAPIPEGYVPGEIASVTAAASGSGRITVSWTASVNTAAYIVQRRVKGADTWTTLKSNVIGTSYVDSTGVVGTVYQYRVRGRNDTIYGPFKLSSVVRVAA